MAHRAIKFLAISLFVYFVSALPQASGDPLADMTGSSQFVDNNNLFPNLMSFVPETNSQEDSNDVNNQKPPLDLETSNDIVGNEGEIDTTDSSADSGSIILADHESPSDYLGQCPEGMRYACCKQLERTKEMGKLTARLSKMECKWLMNVDQECDSYPCCSPMKGQGWIRPEENCENNPENPKVRESFCKVRPDVPGLVPRGNARRC